MKIYKFNNKKLNSQLNKSDNNNTKNRKSGAVIKEYPELSKEHNIASKVIPFKTPNTFLSDFAKAAGIFQENGNYGKIELNHAIGKYLSGQIEYHNNNNPVENLESEEDEEIKETLRLADYYRIPYDVTNPDINRLIQDVDTWEMELSAAKDAGVDWDPQEYDIFALEREVEEKREEDIRYMREMLNDYNATRGVY